MAMFDNFMAGAKKKQDQSRFTTANNPYSKIGGKFYDWGGFDYNRYTGGKPLVNRNGLFGTMRNRGNMRSDEFIPLPTQPTQVASPQTPGALERQDLTSQYQKAMDESKAQNEARYQQALQNLEGVGTQQRADINTRFNSGSSAVNQSLVNAGLSNTTVLPSMQRGVERERQDALNRLAAMLAREKNQVIASRNDIPPDLQLYSQLMYQTGAGGTR